MANSLIVLMILIGLFSGITSGIFGIGGGVIIVPALIYLAKFSQHAAIGTSLAILLPPIGLFAVLDYYRHGNVISLVHHCTFKIRLCIPGRMLIGIWMMPRITKHSAPLDHGVIVLFINS